jgi:hypothetical protein
MAKMCKESRDERADARSSGLTPQIAASCLSYQDRALFGDCRVAKARKW